MTITIIDKAKTVTCHNCGTKVKSSPTGTAKCGSCGSAVKNPPKAGFKAQDGSNKTSKGGGRHNGPAGGGFFPSKQPKGPASGGGSNDPKKKPGAGEMTPAEKKIYQQAYNKVFSATNDKAKADKAGKAAVQASRSAAKTTPTSKSSEMTEFVIEAEISKTNDDRMQAFGWAYVSEKDGVPVVDYSGEHAPVEELEKGAYRYNLESRDSGEMHVSKGVGTLIESVVFTEEKYLAMGFSEDMAKTLPKGWWVGYQVASHDVWKKVKSGEYPMLSIHGKALRKEVAPGAPTLDGAQLVLAAKAEIGAQISYHALSKNARAYLDLTAGQIRSERMSKGTGPNPHGPSIKCPDIYEALKREGKTKTTAARMSNECYQSGDCNCH